MPYDHALVRHLHLEVPVVNNKPVKPRNGHALIAGIVARISGCQNQKDLSLEDQDDHGREVVREHYDGKVEYRLIATTGKGEWLDRPELAVIEALLRTRELDLLICEDPDLAARPEPTPEDVVLVTLAALARVHPGPVPAGVMDEARDLATYGDQFSARSGAPREGVALITRGGPTAYRSVVPQRDWPTGARVNVSGSLADVLESTLAAWAVDGSVVLARNGDRARSDTDPARLASEGVTLSA